jgi:preprotein translocase subunit SecE
VTTGLVVTMVLLASLFFVLVDSVLRFIVKIVIGGGF